MKPIKTAVALSLAQILLMEGPQAGTIRVTTEQDITNGAFCSLRDAIRTANDNLDRGACNSTGTLYTTADDTIVIEAFFTGATTITLNSPLPAISQPVTIVPAGETQISISGANQHQIFNVSRTRLNLSNMKLERGVSSSGGAVQADNGSQIRIERSTISNNSASGNGGGISLDDTRLFLTDSVLSNNSSGLSGGGVRSVNDSLIFMSNSTVFSNTAQGNGAAIYSSGSYSRIENSTISGNIGESAIFHNEDNFFINSSTIANNQTTRGAVYFLDLDEYYVSAMANTIIADTRQGVDCIIEEDSSVSFLSINIIEDGTCSPSVLSGDPGLLPLADNGGYTQTHALSSDSSAIGAISSPNCLFSDQRGRQRKAPCDVGAFESPSDEGFVVIPLKNGRAVVVP